MSWAQCGKCEREFTCDSAFDKHQSANYSKRDSVTCHDPATRGLVLNSRGWWAYPGNRPVPPQGDENAGLADPGLGSGSPGSVGALS